MYKVFIDLNEELSRIDKETRSIRIAEAARRTSSSPAEFFLFPYRADDEGIHLAFRCDVDHFDNYIVFLEELGLDSSRFVEEYITLGEYYELVMEAKDAGLLHPEDEKEEDLLSYSLGDGVCTSSIPENEEPSRYGYRTDDESLGKRIERIVKAGGKESVPVCYYILEGSANRRRTILDNLFYALVRSGRLPEKSKYTSLDFNYYCSRYRTEWKVLNEVFNNTKDEPLAININEYLNISSQDKDAMEFARLVASNKRKVTMLIGDIFEEGLSEALVNSGVRVRVIQDSIYTRHEVEKAVQNQIDAYVNEDLFVHNTDRLFRKIRNCPRKYFSKQERDDLLDYIRDKVIIVPYRERMDSFINAYYVKENVPPMEVLARMPIVSEAKDTILKVLSDHYRLEEKKNNDPGNRPVYTKDYCDKRKDRPKTATDLASLNMILYGPHDESMYCTAKLYADILHECRITAEDRFLRITKGQVVSSNPDKTSGQLRRAFERSLGGVLYIEWQTEGDLFPLDRLLALMEEYDRKVVVILELSEQGMRDNQALTEEKFPYTIHFRHLSSDEAWNYLSYMAKEDGYILGKGVKEKLLDVLKNPVFGNANSLRSILERGKMNMAIRIAPSRTTLSNKTLSTLKPQDFEDFKDLKEGL